MPDFFSNPVVIWTANRSLLGTATYTETDNCQIERVDIFGDTVKQPVKYMPLDDQDAIMDLYIVLRQHLFGESNV